MTLNKDYSRFEYWVKINSPPHVEQPFGPLTLEIYQQYFNEGWDGFFKNNCQVNYDRKLNPYFVPYYLKNSLNRPDWLKIRAEEKYKSYAWDEGYDLACKKYYCKEYCLDKFVIELKNLCRKYDVKMDCGDDGDGDGIRFETPGGYVVNYYEGLEE